MSRVHGTVRDHIDLLRERARHVRRLFVRYDPHTSGGAAQLSGVPVAGRPAQIAGDATAAAAVVVVVVAATAAVVVVVVVAATAAVDTATYSQLPEAPDAHRSAAATAYRPQAAGDDVHHEGGVHIPAGRLPVTGVCTDGVRTRGHVPVRQPSPVHGGLVPVDGPVR